MKLFYKIVLLVSALFIANDSMAYQTNVFANFRNKSDKQYLDSLYYKADSTKADTIRAICYLRISIALELDAGNYYREKSGVDYFELASEIASRENKKISFIKALDKIGVRNRRNGKFKTALRFHMAALSLSDSVNDPKLKSIILNNIGVVYRRVDNYQEALSYHMKAMKLADSINDNRTKAMAVNSLGNVYIALNNYNEALNFFKQSLSLEYIRKNKLGIAINLNNIGSAYQAKGDLSKAYEYYMLSLDVNKEINSLLGIGICHSDIGDVHFEKKEYNKALSEFLTSESIFKQTNDKMYLADSYFKAGKSYFSLNQFDKAQKSLQTSLDISKNIGKKVISQKAYTWLAKTFKKQGMFKKALESFEEATKLQDSINSIAIQKSIIRLQIKYDLETKENQIDILQQLQQIDKLEIRKQKTANLLMLVVIVLILFVIIFLSYSIHTRNQRNQLLQEKNKEIEKAQNELKKHSEDLLVAKQQADKSNKAKTEFLANMSHEFRTPLNSVIGFTDLMLSSETDLEKKEKLSIIKSSSKSLLVLLNDILDLSKIEAGKMEISYQPVNIPQIIIEIYKLFTVHTDAKNIKFSYRIQSNFPEYIIFSEIRFRQILFNTIGNAVKFTDEGEILLELNFVESNKEDKIDFCFRINDTGIGINKNKLDNIFKPFIQLDGNKQQQGTGLGLTITKRLVESMGGEIQVKSDMGVGTSFTIRFINVEKAIHKIASGLNDQVLLTNVKSKLKILLFSGKKDDYSKQLILLKEITNSIKVVEDDLPKAKSLISEVDLIILCGAKNEQVQNAYRVLNQTLSSEKRWFIIITGDNTFRKTKRHPKHFVIKPDIQNLKIVLDEITDEHNKTIESDKLSFCLESLKNNTDFLTHFKDHIYPAFTLAWNTKLMGNIKSFSSELKRSAEEYNMDPIRDFAENLDRNIQNFDIKEVERLLLFFRNYCLTNLI